MDDRALSTTSATEVKTESASSHREGRGIWVLTAYGISGLALFGVLVYYFSAYVTN